MSLVIEPSTHLTFKRPFTSLTDDTLVLKNPTSSPIAFKVKTTAPKQYCVRPNAGRIEAGLEMEVQVVLQPLKEDFPPGYKSKDKFLVQSIVVTPELETLSLHELWPTVEKTNRSAIHERKLRCVFLAADDRDAAPSPGIPNEVIISAAPRAAPQQASLLDGSSFDNRRSSVPGLGSSSPAPFDTPTKSHAPEEFTSPTPMAATLPTQNFTSVSPVRETISTPAYASEAPSASVTNDNTPNVSTTLSSQLESAESTILQLRRELSGYKSEMGSV
ncbi:phosphatidylinositol-binding protein scs2, partial [Tieghemiomyces parasiticus]